MLSKTTVNKDSLIALGFPKSTAQSIIRQAKATLVHEGYTIYLNKRLGVVPKSTVEKLIGTTIGDTHAK